MTRLQKLALGAAFTGVHYVVQWMTWAAADRIPTPGEHHRIPALWPVVSFPAFPVYNVLSGGDTAMIHSFNWVMLGNSVVWGTTIAILVGWIRRPRGASHAET